MQYLFTYGTLQNHEIQNHVFGRRLHGSRDILEAFRFSSEKIMGKYLVVEESKNTSDQIEGVVYELQQNELAMADQYEGEAYKKIEVSLKSGKIAWVYSKA